MDDELATTSPCQQRTSIIILLPECAAATVEWKYCLCLPPRNMEGRVDEDRDMGNVRGYLAGLRSSLKSSPNHLQMTYSYREGMPPQRRAPMISTVVLGLNGLK